MFSHKRMNGCSIVKQGILNVKSVMCSNYFLATLTSYNLGKSKHFIAEFLGHLHLKFFFSLSMNKE